MPPRDPDRSPILEIRRLDKEYRSGGVPFLALHDIDLEIRAGEFLGITGKSGAGKTTLLNMLSGISPPTRGEVLFHGRNGHRPADGEPLRIHDLSEDDLARWRGENLGIVYQSFELMPSLTLVENVMLPPDFSGAYRPVASRDRAVELLELVGIGEHAHKIPAHISGGQKQRVAIARALVNDPSLVVADEPTGNLDSVTAEAILRILEGLADAGKTVVMVTHDESLTRRFSRRLVIHDGRLTNGTASSKRPSAVSVGETAETKPEAADLESGNARRASAASGDAAGPALSLREVTKIYDGPAGRFTALKGIDLELGYGQFISVVGKSGSGKSTLLNMITGIDHPTSGEVVVGGRRIYDLTESERAQWRGRTMGIVFQFFQLLPTLSLLENVMLPMDYVGIHPFSERPGRALELLRRVGLEAMADQLPGSVSSGQQQSAAIARALATDPPILLADEPTGNLDSRSAAAILDLFEDLARRGKTVVIVTHDPAITQRTDQTVILSDGEIVDPAIARALPFLSHPQMLAATKGARRRTIAPGTVILRQGDPVEDFFAVARGEVEVLIRNGTGIDVRLATLGRGQFFGEVELTRGGPSIASVRSAPGAPTELAVLPRSEFQRLVQESAQARQTLESTAEARWRTNQAARQENAG